MFFTSREVTVGAAHVTGPAVRTAKEARIRRASSSERMKIRSVLGDASDFDNQV